MAIYQVFITSLFLLATSAHALNGGATANAGYYSASEGEGVSGFRLHRLDLDLYAGSGANKGYFKFNFVDPYSGIVIGEAAPADNTLANTKIEDAWVQYTYSPMAIIKVGYEDAHWVFDGRNSPIWSGVRLDRAETFQKFEVSGGLSRSLKYAVMIWDDPSGGAEASLGDNLSFKGEYRHSSQISVGAIFRQNKADGVPKSGNTIFGSFGMGSFTIQAKMLNEIKEAEAVGGTAMVAGGSYRVNGTLTIKGYYTSLTAIGSEFAQTIMDVAGWYRANRQVSLYGQYVSFGPLTEGGEGTTMMAFGLQTKF